MKHHLILDYKVYVSSFVNEFGLRNWYASEALINRQHGIYCTCSVAVGDSGLYDVSEQPPKHFISVQSLKERLVALLIIPLTVHLLLQGEFIQGHSVSTTDTRH